MSIHSFSTQAKEPIEFGGDPALATSHLPSPGRALTEVEARELGAICDTTADAAERAQHGRDWWPLSLRWSLRNEVPQIPAVVCRPKKRVVALFVPEQPLQYCVCTTEPKANVRMEETALNAHFSYLTKELNPSSTGQ